MGSFEHLSLTNLPLPAQLQIIIAGLIAKPTNARAANFLPADVLAILLIQTTWVTMAFQQSDDAQHGTAGSNILQTDSEMTHQEMGISTNAATYQSEQGL